MVGEDQNLLTVSKDRSVRLKLEGKEKEVGRVCMGSCPSYQKDFVVKGSFDGTPNSL